AGIGVRVASSANVRIETCSFHLQPPPPAGAGVLEAAIFVTGICSGLYIRNNTFSHSGDVLELNNDNGAFGVRFGVLAVPSSLGVLTISSASGVFSVSGAVFLTSLDDVDLSGNDFTGLSAAMFLYAQIGVMRIEDNSVRNCASGGWALSLQ